MHFSPFTDGPPNEVSSYLVYAILNSLGNLYELHNMVRHSSKGGSNNNGSTSYIEEFSFLSPQLGVKIIQDELEIFILRSLIKNRKSQIIPKVTFGFYLKS